MIRHCLLLCSLLLLAPAAQAQDEDLNIQTLFEKAGELMEESRWQDALVPLERIMKEYGPSGYTDFGPAFGVMHYRYGFALKNLKRFEDALTAYNECYTKGVNAADTPKDKLNPVWELSLLEMAIIKQALGRYDEAIKDYEAFALKPAPAGTYDDAAFRVQVATCYSKAGQPDKAKKLMDQLISGAGGLTPKADGIFRAFLALVESWTAKGTGNAETEKQAHQFIDENIARMRLPPFDMARFDFNTRLLALARNASDNNQQSLAIRLIGLMVTSTDVLHDLQGRAMRYKGSIPDLLKKEIEKYEQMALADDSLDWITLLTLAGCYERMGNYAGAYAIYSHGIAIAPKSSNRPMMLFGAIRTAQATGQSETARTLGGVFRKEFPEHEYAGNVNTLLLENTFFSKQYEEALRLAEGIRAPLPPESKDRDLTDFIVGASLFNLGKIEQAQKELESHAARFPQSKFKEAARYFEAASLQRLKDWQKGGEKLDAFIQDFPDSEYIGFALLDRATVHFQLGEYQKCITATLNLEEKRPGFADLDRAVAMRGDSNLMMERNEEAEKAYLKARALAAEAGDAHAAVAGRILVQLIRTANALKKPKDILAYYDEYMAKYKGGFYDAEVVVGSLEPLKEADRGKEAMDELQQVIIRLGSGDTGTGIEEAIGSYTQNYVEIVGAEPLLEKLMSFVPEGTQINNTLKAWLLMARIDLLENEAYKDQFPRRSAQILVAFEELQKFNKEELATYILVQIGRYLAARGESATDAQALEWFKAVMDRGPSDHYALALMGRARVLAKTGDSATFKEAIGAFDQVIRELKDKPEYVEEAMLDKGRIYFGKEMWKEAADVFYAMQKDKRFTRSRAEVFYRLGISYEKLGKEDEALEAFTPFVGPPLENFVDYSAEARVRAAEIQMKRGNNDKAFRLIKDTVSRMFKLTNHPKGGPWVIKAKDHYKKLRDLTGAPPDPDEGVWGVR